MWPSTVFYTGQQPLIWCCVKWERGINDTISWENSILMDEKAPYMEAYLKSSCLIWSIQKRLESLVSMFIIVLPFAFTVECLITWPLELIWPSLQFLITVHWSFIIILVIHLIIIIIIRSTVEKLQVVCHFRWAMPSLTFKVTLAIIEVSHITVSRLN